MSPTDLFAARPRQPCDRSLPVAPVVGSRGYVVAGEVS
jgi:hypothetical protein